MSFTIGKTPVRYYPVTGEMFRENPIPERAVKTRASSSEQLARSGIGRIDWDLVISYTAKQISAFKAQMELKGSLLATNAKTDKPRKTGRYGKIAGLSLAPHFYPNFLNKAEVDETTNALQYVAREDFNLFRGRTPKEASEDSGVPTSKLLNFCVGSTEFCRASCLVFTGQNPLTKEAANSKIRNTYAFLYHPELFVALLRKNVISFAKSCKKTGDDPVIRLNMLSDLPWYSMCPELLIECAEEHGVVWYDYTKVPFWNSADYKKVKNILDLTFSYSGGNEKQCAEALKAGYRIAAVFSAADQSRPASIEQRTTFKEIQYLGRESGLVDSQGRINMFGGWYKFINGDKSDYRIDDPGRSIVCLNFKQPSVSAKGQYSRLWEAIPEARTRFAVAVEDPEKQGALYSKALRSNKFMESLAAEYGVSSAKKLDIDSIPVKTVLARYQAFLKQTSKRKNPLEVLVDDPSTSITDETSISMLPIKGTGVLIGPHVPTVLND